MINSTCYLQRELDTTRPTNCYALAH